MFALRFFAPHMFAPRYFAEVGSNNQSGVRAYANTSFSAVIVGATALTSTTIASTTEE